MALFTRENAREMALRGNQIRWSPKPPPAIDPQLADLVTSPDYNQRRLARTRMQIDALSTMLEDEEEPQSIDRLASAIARLSVIEQQLSGRPLPGTLQPGREKPARLMLSPAVDAGHAQQPASMEATKPVSDTAEPAH